MAVFSRDGCSACGPATNAIRAVAREAGTFDVVVVDGEHATRAKRRISVEGYPTAVVFSEGKIHGQYLMPDPADVCRCVDDVVRPKK